MRFVGRSGWRLLLAAGFAALLGACGGGGGGGGATGGPTPSVREQPLVLTQQNVGGASAAPSATAETLLQFGQLAVDHVNRLASDPAGRPRAETCPNGGLVTTTLLDADLDHQPSTGDRLTVEWRDCGVPLVGSVLNGTMVVDLVSVGSVPSRLVGTLDLGGGVFVTDGTGSAPGLNAVLRGSLRFDSTRTTFRTSLRVTSTPADDFRLEFPSGGKTFIEAMRAFDVSKELLYDEARSVVSLALRLESDSLGGSVTATTPRVFKSYLNTHPEEGGLEVRGAGAALIRVSPNFVVSNERYLAELDANGDGNFEAGGSVAWIDAVQGYLWWDGVASPTWSTQPYATQNYQTTQFNYSVGGFVSPGVNDAFRLQFSRPPTPAPTLQFRFRDNGSTRGYDPVFQDIAANVAAQGAIYVMRPSRPLRHARSYNLEFSTDGVNWFGNITVQDALRNSLTVYSAIGGFATADSMRAVIDSSGEVLVSPAASTQLSAANSISTLRPIASYGWSQLGGTPLVFSAPQSASTQVSWGAQRPSGLENVVVELTITDTAGEVETARVTVSSLDPLPVGRVLYLRSTPGDYVGGGKTVLVGDSTGNLSSNPLNSGYVTYNYFAADFSSFWFLNLATADGAGLRAGAFENAVRAPFHNNANGLELSGPGGCSQIAGRFDVQEIETDSQGVISKLAVDFEQHCETAQAPPLFGSLRINSTFPIRP